MIFTTENIESIRIKDEKGLKISREEKYWLDGNKSVKRCGISFQMTDYEELEYIKCVLGIDINGKPIVSHTQDVYQTGIEYFCDNYVKIKSEDGTRQKLVLRDYQKDMLDLYSKNRFSILNGSRQIGKSVIAGILVLYFVTFSNEKNVLMVSNKLESVKELITKVKNLYYELPFFLKPTVSNWTQTTLVFDSTSCVLKVTAATRSAGVGSNIDLLYLDEMAHLPPNIKNDFYKSLIPTIESMENSKVVITSTPNGFDLFYDIIQGSLKPKGHPQKNPYASLTIPWQRVDARFVVYLEIKEELYKKYDIKNEEILNFLKEIGFQPFLKVDNKKGISTIHVPIKKNKMSSEIYNKIINFGLSQIDNPNYDKEEDASNYIRSLIYNDIKLTDIHFIQSWRQEAILKIGGIEFFNQEFAVQFSSSIDSILDPITLNNINSKKILFENYDIDVLNEKTTLKFNDLIWLKDREDIFSFADCKRDYFMIAVDLGEGLGGDYTTFNIFKLVHKNENEFLNNEKNIHEFFKLEQVGLFRNNTYSISEAAILLYLICFEVLNQDNIGVVLEINTFGNELLKDMINIWNGRNDFSNHIFLRYKHKQEANAKFEIGIKLRRNKELFVKEYQKRMKMCDIVVHEENTIREISTFIKKPNKNGGFKFEGGSGHDDICMTVVELSSVFEHNYFKDMCSRYYDEKLPTHIKDKIDKIINNSESSSSLDYSSAINARRNVYNSNNNWKNIN